MKTWLVDESPDDITPSVRESVSGNADHSKFEVLQGPLTSGPEVTKACLSCHTEAGKHFMKSIHWTWEYKNPDTGQLLGKKTLINTFCTNAKGNEGMCAQCHASYGWKDDSFVDHRALDQGACDADGQRLRRGRPEPGRRGLSGEGRAGAYTLSGRNRWC